MDLGFRSDHIEPSVSLLHWSTLNFNRCLNIMDAQKIDLNDDPRELWMLHRDFDSPQHPFIEII